MRPPRRRSGRKTPGAPGIVGQRPDFISHYMPLLDMPRDSCKSPLCAALALSEVYWQHEVGGSVPADNRRRLLHDNRPRLLHGWQFHSTGNSIVTLSHSTERCAPLHPIVQIPFSRRSPLAPAQRWLPLCEIQRRQQQGSLGPSASSFHSATASPLLASNDKIKSQA